MNWRALFAEQNWTFGELTLTDEHGAMHFGYYVQPMHLNPDDRDNLPRKVLHALARQKPPLDFLELTGAGFRIVNPNAARVCGCGTSFEPVRPA